MKNKTKLYNIILFPLLLLIYLSNNIYYDVAYSIVIVLLLNIFIYNRFKKCKLENGISSFKVVVGYLLWNLNSFAGLSAVIIYSQTNEFSTLIIILVSTLVVLLPISIVFDRYIENQ